jgi:hypothetical protein
VKYRQASAYGQTDERPGLSVFYLRDDNEADLERCRDSLDGRAPVTITGLGLDGRIATFTGFVQSIEYNEKRGAGTRWLVNTEIEAAFAAPAASDAPGRREGTAGRLLFGRGTYGFHCKGVAASSVSLKGLWSATVAAHHARSE